MTSFNAFVLTKDDDGRQHLDWTSVDESDLMDGDVTVEVSHSTMNYKDGLALTGASPVVRRWPMIPGTDFVGTVSASSHALPGLIRPGAASTTRSRSSHGRRC